MSYLHEDDELTWVAPLVKAFAKVGSERTAIDSMRRMLQHPDGTRLTAAEARTIVRAIRAGNVG